MFIFILHNNCVIVILRNIFTLTNIYLQFFEKKGVPDIKTADDLFKSITGFEEVDVNLLEGVHTTYNSLSSRFEIAPDDNRNISYPFEYCWQKTNEKKGKSDESCEEDDEFDEMWYHSKQNKVVDIATNFGNELAIDNIVIDKGVNFGNPADGTIPSNQLDIDSSGVDKKS